MRPVLKPALRVLWRDDTTVQFGVDPRHAVAVAGVARELAPMLRLLDGTRRSRDVVDDAVAAGADRTQAERLLRLLVEAGVVDDAATTIGVTGSAGARLAPDLAALSLLVPGAGGAAATLARRRTARVLVIGGGRVAAALASALAAAGVGRLLLRGDDRAALRADAAPGGLRPADEGRSRLAATADAIAAATDGEVSVDARGGPPSAHDVAVADLAVLAPDGWPAAPPGLVAALSACGLPYLVVGVRETTGVVGPLVLPGRTSCPRCHDLTRTDRDPAWPALAAQLATPGRGPAPCDVTLAVAVAGFAAGQVVGHLGNVGPRLCLDATLELRLPEWSLRRRSWRPHPHCDCGAAAAAALEQRRAG